MAEKLELMRDCAALRSEVTKESRMRHMNSGSKARELKVGDKVLNRIPGLQCKLADSWEGPYVVVERMGKVNYKIGKQGSKKRCKTVHINCRKRYWERGNV